MDVYQWIVSVFDCLLFQPMRINVGFSFLTEDTVNSTIGYWYAVQELAYYKTKVVKKSDLTLFENVFKGKNETALLNDISLNTAEPFVKSGIRPYKIVCAYIWLIK